MGVKTHLTHNSCAGILVHQVLRMLEIKFLSTLDLEKTENLKMTIYIVVILKCDDE